MVHVSKKMFDKKKYWTLRKKHGIDIINLNLNLLFHAAKNQFPKTPIIHINLINAVATFMSASFNKLPLKTFVRFVSCQNFFKFLLVSYRFICLLIKITLLHLVLILVWFLKCLRIKCVHCSYNFIIFFILLQVKTQQTS